MWQRFKQWLRMGVALPVTSPAPVPLKITDHALAEARMGHGAPLNPWTVPAPPAWLPAGAALAMDAAPGGTGLSDIYAWANRSAFSEGLGFLGYGYLSELSQRPEYRRVSEIIASEATRQWIKLKSDDEDRTKLVIAALERFEIKARLREASEQDGFFGRSQIFIDFGHPLNSKELAKPLPLKKIKIGPGSVKNFKVVEPFWSYPGQYNSVNPLAADYYRPKFWYVMSGQVHADRLISFVSRDVPDILKPQYMFGGMSLSQLVKPYVDNWIRTRQSVSDLIHSFSTSILYTDMTTLLAGGSADSVIKRAAIHNAIRDNNGMLLANKGTEEFANVSTPLSTLDKLLAQSQEQIASVCGIPLVVLLGITPSGLNASSEGELSTWHDYVHSYQERFFRGPLKTIIDILQLDLDGELDPSLTFEFVPLADEDEAAAAAVRKTNADIDSAYVTNGVVSPEEVRARIATDEDSPYFGVDLSAEPPEPEDDGDDEPTAMDEWREDDHPRGKGGQFGSGGGGSSAAAKPPGGKAAKGAPAPAKVAAGGNGGAMVTASGKPIPHHVVEHLGRENVERLKSMIADKSSKAADLLAILNPLDNASKGIAPTVPHGTEPTAKFWAGRKYHDPETGAAMGIAQAHASLVAKAESYAGAAGVKRDKQARLLLGPPAAGKSTSAERIAETGGYAIVDGDDAKKVIPEFAGGVGASAVHEESSEMAGAVLDTMLARGDNVILPLVGGSPGSIRKRIERLKLAGYAVTVDLVDVDEDEAARRMAGRALSTGRHISSSYFMSIGDGPSRTYETLKAENPDLGFGKIDGNGAAREERYREAVNHPSAKVGSRLFD